MKDTETTLVVFRKFKDSGNVIALFPEVDHNGRECSSYMYIGQHGPADYDHCIDTTIPATPAEYADLKKELESIGYNLKIRKKYIRK